MNMITLPSPKVVSGKLGKSRRWYRFYAMFSEEFARQAIAEARLPANSVILDPWVGVGTATAAAALAGHRAFGIDINPVMTTISRGRCVSRAAADRAVHQIAKSVIVKAKPPHTNEPLIEWFSPNASREIRRWADAINNSSSGVEGPAKVGFLFTALFEAVWKLAAGYRSKNPTWIKAPEAGSRATVSASQLKELFLGAAKEKIALLADNPVRRPEIEVGTSRDIRIAAASVDFVLTSPPYCTRIDYAMATRLELAILGHGAGLLGSLRKHTMGSSTIRESMPKPMQEWGDTCVGFLNLVTTHPSKGSINYYLKTFLQYFDDLYASLSQVDCCLRSGGRAVLVVQDSFYKGVHANLPVICAEMALSLGWSLTARQDHVIVRSMRDVNTRSRRYGGGEHTESVLWFAKQ